MKCYPLLDALTATGLSPARILLGPSTFRRLIDEVVPAPRAVFAGPLGGVDVLSHSLVPEGYAAFQDAEGRIIGMFPLENRPAGRAQDGEGGRAGPLRADEDEA